MNLFKIIRKHKIILIDNDEWVRDSIRMFFESENCEILTFETAEEALQSSLITACSVFIVDYSLPGMDGLNFFKKIRLSHPAAVKILISAYGNSDVLSQLKALDVQYFIEKPFTTQALEKAFLSLINQGKFPDKINNYSKGINMDDSHSWDWETSEKKIRLDEWKSSVQWVEEFYVSPDGEKVAAIVKVDDEDFSVCVNGDLWESRYEKIWHLRFSPNNCATALAANMDEWTVAVDDLAWENTFDYIWDMKFSADGEKTGIAFQKESEYGMAVNDTLWEKVYSNISFATLNSSGNTTAAVIQTKSINEADVEAFQDGIFSVCENGIPWATSYINVWDIDISSDGKIVAASIRTDLYNYKIIVNGTPWKSSYNCVWKPSVNPVRSSVSAPVKVGKFWTLAEDEKIIWKRKYNQLWNNIYSPNGESIAAIVAPKFGKWTVAVDDKSWNTSFDEYLGDLTYSPDGTGIAAIGKHKGKWHLVHDGVKDKSGYDRLWKPVFSPAGSQLACKAEKDGKYYVLLNKGLLEDSYDYLWDPSFSPCGKFVLIRSIRDGSYYRRILKVN